MILRATIGLLLCICISRADTNVTSFGAIGDTLQVVLNTTSGSATVNCGTNVFASGDVGKIIQMFQAGAATSGGYHQDLVAVIKTFNSATQVVLDRNCGNSSNGVVAWFGTDCRPGFQRAVSEGIGIVTVPSGRYTLLSPEATNATFTMANYAETYPAVYLSKGGITLQGAGASTILHGCGAWQLKGSYVYRGAMFFNSAVTNNGELAFRDMEIYGGVINGKTDTQNFPASTTTGDWWDVTHSAFIDILPMPMHYSKVYSNVYFHNWRGEMVKSVIGLAATNQYIQFQNSVFGGGNASCINYSSGMSVLGCTFSNAFFQLEVFQDYSRSNSVWAFNTCSDIGGVVVVGAVTNRNPYPWLFTSNTIHLNGIQLGNAQNVTITRNTFDGNAGGYAVQIVGSGVQPSDGTATIASNIYIAHNNFSDTFSPLYINGIPATAVRIINNTSTVAVAFMQTGSYLSNFVFSGNSGLSPADGTMATAGFYPFDDGNYLPAVNNFVADATLTYARGRYHALNNSGGNFTLLSTNLNPQGASMVLTNPTAGTTHVLGLIQQADVAASGVLTCYWYSPRWYTNLQSSVGGNLNIGGNLILGQ